MAVASRPRSPFFLARVLLLSWLTMLGVDFFLHGGLLADLYTRSSPFLLPPERAFQLIPVGYLAFLLLAILLLWLMRRGAVSGGRAGLIFGLKLGLLSWGALILGLISISTADLDLMIAWWLGQSLELGLAGAVTGRALVLESHRRLALLVAGLCLLLVIVTIVLQSIGLAPQARIG